MSSTAAISFKKRSKPTLTRKLHELTKAPALGINVHKTNLGQGKRRVWIGREAAKELRSTYAPAPSTQRAVTSPSMESERAEVVTRLRKQLVVECGETPPPALAFERWLLDSLLVEEMSATSKLDKSTSTTTTNTTTNTIARFKLKFINK